MKISKSKKPASQPVRRRKPGTERRREIAQVAAELFASHGFAVSTRTISDKLGITQAALYKHFRSKEELVEAVFQYRYLDERVSDFKILLNSGDQPLLDRLTHAYSAFFSDMSETSLKLFHRASYDSLEIAKRYSPHLDERIIWPVLSQLRRQAGLATLEDKPASFEEREMALMLHSAIVFLGIRKFVYRVDFKGRESTIIHQYVKTWLAGALATIDQFHTA